MKRSLLGAGVVALLCVASSAVAQPSSSARRLPSLPGGDPPSPGEDGTVSGAAGARAQFEQVRRGIVAIERGGVPLAIGMVLGGDGRVLTALSGLGGLGGGDVADVRYADGTIVHAKLGRADRAADLALLVPQPNPGTPEAPLWTDGLRASEADPTGLDLRAMLPIPIPRVPGASPDPRLGPVLAVVKGAIDAHARDGVTALRLLDVDVKGPVVGAPILDSGGSVVGILVRACKGAVAPPPAPEDAGAGAWPSAPSPAVAAARSAACRLVVLGAPVTSIRAFLGRPAPGPAAPWLGIRGEGESSGNVHGVRVVAVAPASPAEKAALKPGTDVIVAVDGHPIDAPERLSELIAKHAPGETVKLLVFGGEAFRDVVITLRKAP